MHLNIDSKTFLDKYNEKFESALFPMIFILEFENNYDRPEWMTRWCHVHPWQVLRAWENTKMPIQINTCDMAKSMPPLNKYAVSFKESKLMTHWIQHQVNNFNNFLYN